MKSAYSNHLEVQRRRADEALAACGFESLAIYAGGLRTQFLDDQPYPFKPNPHFKLWMPLADPVGCWIAYRPGHRLQLIFLQPVDYWHKPPVSPTGFWTDHFDIATIHEASDAKALLTGLPRCAFIGEWSDEFAPSEFAAINPPALLNRLHFQRAVKTAYELECMRRASARAASAHRAAETAFRSGASEYEIHQEYLLASRQTENELPYPNIIALNAHAAVLHYQHQERTAPAERHSFLIDAGAQVDGYASDITRTYSHADDEFGALIEGMHKLQQALCSQVKSGVDFAAVHLDAHRRIGELLRERNFISLDGPAALSTGLSGVFFPHGLGHLLGLQVHDVGGFMKNAAGEQIARPAGHPYLRLTRTLEPGFVVTVEPGIYFIESLLDGARSSALAKHINWDQVERFKRCGGIRIEDNVVCTDGEPENITRDAFAVRL